MFEDQRGASMWSRVNMGIVTVQLIGEEWDLNQVCPHRSTDNRDNSDP